MTELAQVRKKSQVTLPPAVRKKLGLEEGDFIEFESRDNEIVIKAKRLIDKDQAWFWTKRWQEGERQADEDIKAGRGRTFADAEDTIAFLHEEASTCDETQAVKKNKKKATR